MLNGTKGLKVRVTDDKNSIDVRTNGSEKST